MTQRTVGNAIVVGVDGSDASLAALRWASEQASAQGSEIVAVHVWEPAPAGLAPYAPAAARPTDAERRERAAALLATAVRTVFGPRIGPGVRAVLREGQPSRVLLHEARGALLLALGRRAHGHGELPAMGAVGRECLRHARVPVVAVPEPERAAPRLRLVRTPALSGSGGA